MPLGEAHLESVDAQVCALHKWVLGGHTRGVCVCMRYMVCACMRVAAVAGPFRTVNQHSLQNSSACMLVRCRSGCVNMAADARSTLLMHALTASACRAGWPWRLLEAATGVPHQVATPAGMQQCFRPTQPITIGAAHGGVPSLHHAGM